jgi:hypothetical protein
VPTTALGNDRGVFQRPQSPDWPVHPDQDPGHSHGPSSLPGVAGYPLNGTGLTGATAAARFAGGTVSGHPVSGTFALGDFVVDQSGAIWVCISAGTPGTWTELGGGGGSTPVPWVNVQTYGTVGDGTTDDITAIQNAINACPAGGVVLFPQPSVSYAISTAPVLAGSSKTAPKVVKLLGFGVEDQAPILKCLASFTASTPSLDISTKYAPGGTATQFTGFEVENLVIDQTAATTLAGVYYDRVQQVRMRKVKVIGGATAHVVGWANDLRWESPDQRNQTDVYWRWFRAYSTHAPWDTANAGKIIGTDYSDQTTFYLSYPLNYLTTAGSATAPSAFFDILSGNDFQIIGGHSLRTPGGTGYVTCGINVDFSAFGSQKNLYLFCDFHELDAIWDGNTSPSNGAGVRLVNAHFARFGANAWVGAYSAADSAEMWCLDLKDTSDVVVAPGGHWSGRGVRLDGTNTQLEVRGQFPQPLSDPIFTAAATGLIHSTMNTAALPQASIDVDTIAGTWPTTGSFAIATSTGPAMVSYTGYSDSGGTRTFTGCTGGSGTLSTGGGVVSGKIWGSSEYGVRYTGSLADSAQTLAALVAGTATRSASPMTVLGNATTPALKLARAMDSKVWAISPDNSSTDTLNFTNPEGSVAASIADSGQVTVFSLVVKGAAGSTTQSRFMGAHAGAPTTGTYLTNDWVLDTTNFSFQYCTAGGPPGTWVEINAIPGGAAGGSLAGTFPNPTIASSAALPGSPTTTTQAATDASTKVATTAYVTTALSNLGVPYLYAAAYGIGANGASASQNTTRFNDLLKLAEKLQTTIVLPSANTQFFDSDVYTNAPIVHRSRCGIMGVGGTLNGGAIIRLAANSNCNVMQYQRYIPGVNAFVNNGTKTYTTDYTSAANAFATYGGYYYACLVGYTPNSAATPDADPYHWVQLSPINQTTFNGVVSLSNGTPVNATVTDGTQFGQYGGVMQFVNSGTTYTLLYTGVSGNTVQGCTLASGSVTIAGNETIFPFDTQQTSTMNVALHGNWPAGQSAGRFDAVNMYSSTNGQDFNFNVECIAGTGDGWGTIYPNRGNGFAYGGQRVHLGCSALYNSGTGKVANVDSNTGNDVAGANGLGGHLIACNSTSISTSKSWNNGRQPIFKAQRTISDGVTNSTTTFTSATAAFTSDDIGQGIFDGASPGAGDIPAGTYIKDVVSATQVTLSKAATASHTGLSTKIAGYYFWPTVSGSANIITGCVGATDGIFYVLKVSSITNASDPSGNSDTTHWQQIRLASEWGWDVTETNSCQENSIQIDCQAAKFGSYNAINSTGSQATVTSNGWISNPWTWNGSLGAVIGNYTVPTGLQAAGCVNLGSSVGHNIRVSATQQVSSGSLGTLVQAGTATNCVLQMTSDSHYATALTGIIQPTTTVIINGAQYGPTGPLNQLVTGTWYPQFASAADGNTPTEFKGYATPFLCTATHTFTQMGCRVGTTGQANTVVQFAIYADNGGTPVGGALVWSSNGTAVAAVTNGASVTQNLSAGAFASGWTSTLGPGLYWLCLVPQGTATPSQLRTAAAPGVGTTAPAGGTGIGFITNAAGITTNFPSTFPAATASANCVATAILA